MSEVEQCDYCGKTAKVLYFGNEKHSFCSEGCFEAYECEHSEDE